VLPWVSGLGADAEDSQSLDAAPASAGSPVGAEDLRVVAVRLPRTSNATDVDALAAEPGVTLRWSTSPAAVRDADLVVVPGTRATVADLGWLRGRGIAAVLAERAASGRPILGICGGYQMLARTVSDDVESRRGTVAGLGLLPTEVAFAAAKTVGRARGEAYGQAVTTGYEIHHGRASVDDPLPAAAEPFLDGCRHGAVWGTSWHGALESDGFRRAFLRAVADRAGRDFTPAPDTEVAALRAARLDTLADLVADHLDTAALSRLVEGGPPSGLPFVPPGAPR
jgi:adenosylcobyric acid synthase